MYRAHVKSIYILLFVSHIPSSLPYVLTQCLTAAAYLTIIYKHAYML